jgi:hypothetical protein
VYVSAAQLHACTALQKSTQPNPPTPAVLRAIHSVLINNADPPACMRCSSRGVQPSRIYITWLICLQITQDSTQNVYGSPSTLLSCGSCGLNSQGGQQLKYTNPVLSEHGTHKAHGRSCPTANPVLHPTSTSPELDNHTTLSMHTRLDAAAATCHFLHCQLPADDLKADFTRVVHSCLKLTAHRLTHSLTTQNKRPQLRHPHFTSQA